MIPIRKGGGFRQHTLKRCGDGSEGSCGGSGKQVAKHGRFGRESRVTSGQEIARDLLDVFAHCAISLDDFGLNAEMRTNVPVTKTETKIALGWASRVSLPLALDWLMDDQERGKRINSILDARVECRGYVVLKMRVLFVDREIVAVSQAVISLPNVSEHDADDIGAETSGYNDEILGNREVRLNGRFPISQEKPPRWRSRACCASQGQQRRYPHPARPRTASNSGVGWV